MRDVDRGDFITSDKYEDAPQSIGYEATISAPHMVCGHGADRLQITSVVLTRLMLFFGLALH